MDLYDDVIAAPPGAGGENQVAPGGPPLQNNDGPHHGGPPYHHHMGNNIASNMGGRRFQLYVGNLTWWTTDQDICEAVIGTGVNDFLEVKFFENRANGQSKGFCVISLGSEQSMRMCMDRLPKKELHGQTPVVTFPSKQALNQFEAQSKTRPTPPPNNQGQRPPHLNHAGPHPGGPPRMMMGPQMRARMPPPGMPGGPPGGPRMPGPHMGHPGGPPGPPPSHQGPPGFQHNSWNAPRQNGKW